MHTNHLPRKAGIYQIVNTTNSKCYVGSAVDIQVRGQQHKRALENNAHANKKLQHAWNKYGAEAFDIRVLELIDSTADLLSQEQYWLDTLGSVKNGYNIAIKAGSNLGLVFSEETLERNSRAKSKPIGGFISPNGDVVTIQNMRSFCREHGLTQNLMYMLAQGRATTHKGWSHINAKKPARKWINTYEGFVNPQGELVDPVENLEQFSRAHGLDSSSMNRLYRGKTPSHHGWTHINSVNKRNAAKRVRTYYGFVNPQGDSVVITNLTKFCRDNSLDHATMYKVLMGDARYKQHKGWTYNPDKERQPE